LHIPLVEGYAQGEDTRRGASRGSAPWHTGRRRRTIGGITMVTSPSRHPERTRVHLSRLIFAALALLSACGPGGYVERTVAVEVAQKAVVPALDGPVIAGAQPEKGRVILSGSVRQTLVQPRSASAGGPDAAAHLVPGQTYEGALELGVSETLSLGLRGGWSRADDRQALVKGMDGDGPRDDTRLSVAGQARLRLKGDARRGLMLVGDFGVGSVGAARLTRVRAEATHSYLGPDWQWSAEGEGVERRRVDAFSAAIGMQGTWRYGSGVGVGGGVMARRVPYVDAYERSEQYCAGPVGETTCTSSSPTEIPWVQATTIITYWLGVDYTSGSLTAFLEVWVHGGGGDTGVTAAEPGGGRLGVRWAL
jgi:hypothetical protein